MVVELAVLVLIVSFLSTVQIERREARLRAGAPAWVDLARITGEADPRALARLPGVSRRSDGSWRLDPTRRDALPVHLAGSLVEHRMGHGLSLALAIACLGIFLELGALPQAAAMLLGAAAFYQLVARLYALVVWVEARTCS
jgi:hypothetical protein